MALEIKGIENNKEGHLKAAPPRGQCCESAKALIAYAEVGDATLSPP